MDIRGFRYMHACMAYIALCVYYIGVIVCMIISVYCKKNSLIIVDNTTLCTAMFRLFTTRMRTKYSCV